MVSHARADHDVLSFAPASDKESFPTGRKFAAGFVTYCPFRPENQQILLDKVPGLWARIIGVRCQGSSTRDSGFGIRVRAMKGNRTGELIIWEIPPRCGKWAVMLSEGGAAGLTMFNHYLARSGKNPGGLG